MNQKINSAIKTVNCPTCQKIVPWKEESTFRPFCSKKCQLIDFGEWANENHAIPLEEGPEDFKLDEFELKGLDGEGS
jgi:uncharacterized protein